jgi:hypothetical protein
MTTSSSSKYEFEREAKVSQVAIISRLLTMSQPI